MKIYRVVFATVALIALTECSSRTPPATELSAPESPDYSEKRDELNDHILELKRGPVDFRSLPADHYRKLLTAGHGVKNPPRDYVERDFLDAADFFVTMLTIAQQKLTDLRDAARTLAPHDARYRAELAQWEQRLRQIPPLEAALRQRKQKVPAWVRAWRAQPQTTPTSVYDLFLGDQGQLELLSELPPGP